MPRLVWGEKNISLLLSLQSAMNMLLAAVICSFVMVVSFWFFRLVQVSGGEVVWLCLVQRVGSHMKREYVNPFGLRVNRTPQAVRLPYLPIEGLLWYNRASSGEITKVKLKSH